MNETWTMKDLDRILISDMTDNHLKNTYLMLVTKQEENKYIYEEMIKRGFDVPIKMELVWDWGIVSNYDEQPF